MNNVSSGTLSLDFGYRAPEAPKPGEPGEWGLLRTHTFFYDGWNLALETVAHTNGTVDRIEYVWGLDLSGTLQGAGGVGGLLAVKIGGQIYIPFYDNNGNISEYVDTLGNIRAHYEYSPFGESIAQAGDLADTFPHRFSTKYYDAETRSYYYGYRHYAPMLGCWFSMDPAGEVGGINQYGFVNNDPINNYDTLGLLPATPWVGGGLGDYAQLATALFDFLNGGPSVTYDFEYPDSVTKRLLNHADVMPTWNAFKEASCKGKGAGYPKTRKISHVASTFDFVVDMKTLWGVFDVFENLNIENAKTLDFGVRILGSFGGDATISVDCNTCEKKLSMTLRDSFTMESLTRNPFNRKQSLVKYPFLSPVTMLFHYDIKEQMQ